MTVFTIVYNGYERFLVNWLQNISKQTTKPEEVIIVSGNGTFIDEKFLKNIYPFTHYHVKSDVMGVLRNKAVENIKSEYMLYFSADDCLLPNAIETLKKYNEDVIALTYEDIQINKSSIKRKSAIFKNNTNQWKILYPVPGYHCIRRIINNKVMYYEEIEIPNFPYLFMLESENASMVQTEEVIAKYIRRVNSHGFIANKQNKFIEYSKYIDGRVEHYAKKTR